MQPMEDAEPQSVSPVDPQRLVDEHELARHPVSDAECPLCGAALVTRPKPMSAFWVRP
jgi:hypothetical protein